MFEDMRIETLRARMDFRKAVLLLGLTAVAAFWAYGKGGAGGVLSHQGKEVNGVLHDIIRDSRTGFPMEEARRLAEVIVDESRNYNIDPLFTAALIKTESGFRRGARSEKGALGLMQIRLSTGKGMAEELRLGWDGEKTLLNPYSNVKLGLYYLSGLFERYDKDAKAALAAYNLGPTELDERLSGGRAMPRVFAERVFANYSEFKERVNQRP
ncbi:MAG: transglycosylase SLT domain-containing protein [Deltaproteobacteria bacterium]|nr:transglycosylase SLT domain-containing protein [Deltaproteobacteria bacterium]